MTSEQDKAKATQLKREIEALRAKRNDARTTRAERSRLKLEIEARPGKGSDLIQSNSKHIGGDPFEFLQTITRASVHWDGLG